MKKIGDNVDGGEKVEEAVPESAAPAPLCVPKRDGVLWRTRDVEGRGERVPFPPPAKLSSPPELPEDVMLGVSVGLKEGTSLREAKVVDVALLSLGEKVTETVREGRRLRSEVGEGLELPLPVAPIPCIRLSVGLTLSMGGIEECNDVLKRGDTVGGAGVPEDWAEKEGEVEEWEETLGSGAFEKVAAAGGDALEKSLVVGRGDREREGEGDNVPPCIPIFDVRVGEREGEEEESRDFVRDGEGKDEVEATLVVEGVLLENNSNEALEVSESVGGTDSEVVGVTMDE